MQSGANGMRAGDRVVYLIDKRRGVAQEFFHDGDACVLFDGAEFSEMVKWHQLLPELTIEAVLNRDLKRIADIDQKFHEAHSWGSWMAGASSERHSLVEKARKYGRSIEHKYLMLPQTGTISDQEPSAIKPTKKSGEHRAPSKFEHSVWPEQEYQELDAGIRFAVRVLHARGVETCQSCQGGPGHAYPEPTVELQALADDALGFIALAALQEYHLPVTSLSITWRVANGMPYEKLWRITFFRTMEDRADEIPLLTYGVGVAGVL